MSNARKTIEIIVTSSGETSVQTKGFAGESCRDATRYLERALGEVATEQLTPEFYLTQPTRQENRTQN